MKILFVGDVYGSSGQQALKDNLLKIKQEHNIDFTIVNAENATKGKSLSRDDYDELSKLNIDVFTMGNHAFFGDKLNYLDEVKNIITPANMNEYQKEPGTGVFDCRGLKIRVSNILGQVFMAPGYSSPFKKIEEIIANDKSDIHIVDFHAEATSEKVCFGWDLDGKVTAVLGTHTHVQTADNKILPNGTAYITDVGMTGAYNSAIGVEMDIVLNRQKYNQAERFKECSNPGQLSAVVITVSERTKKAEKIERILITP